MAGPGFHHVENRLDCFPGPPSVCFRLLPLLPSPQPKAPHPGACWSSGLWDIQLSKRLQVYFKPCTIAVPLPSYPLPLERGCSSSDSGNTLRAQSQPCGALGSPREGPTLCESATVVPRRCQIEINPRVKGPLAWASPGPQSP